MIPNAPFRPTYAVSTRLLQLYYNLRCRCPHLGVQPFVKGLLDMHSLAYRPYHNTVFSICFDLYLDILEKNRSAVLKTLDRDRPLWRIQNTCPACSYKLHDEKDMKFKMLITMDGNNSLKRVRRDVGELSASDARKCRSALPDSRSAPGDYYISREEVDKWAKGTLDKELNRHDPNDDSETVCSGRWTNMVDALTSRMWGIFDETGVFLALCRHGFVLLVSDMVRSGELAKYPLAITSTLLKAFGGDLGLGYDIGCKFGKTIKNSPLGRTAAELNLQCLVGSFHGHAHKRLCQLSYLATYTEGLGLEDLEGCERFFSKSNALARSIRYATVFHRQQAIVNYMRHVDEFETYANLSKFIVDNYKQALKILQTEAPLRQLMKRHGITDPAIFRTWLDEEKTYLSSLLREPPEETLEIEYYERLVQLFDYQDDLNTEIFHHTNPDNVTQRDRTRSIEAKRRHAIERRDNCLKRVHELEIKLKVMRRWERGSEEWNAAAKKVVLREYRKAVDRLESLAVSRISELSKMNESQICNSGYNLRNHISAGVKARSKTIRTALEKYNEAAAALNPAAPELTWKMVVEYAVLADFDLLRDVRQDVRKKPWASSTNRLLRDQYFKLERAREEIDRLNIEIRRVITYIADEAIFLQMIEEAVAADDARLAHQITLYGLERGRSNAVHIKRFAKLAKDPGFTGNVRLGQSPSGHLSQGINDDADTGEDDADDEDDEEEEAEEEEAAYDIAYKVLKVSSDAYTEDDDL
ncbi:hypothetical protein F5887DRAFT_1063021 [Amanita rubescens]|nr:hypothetical protein F5887DRAFT_1063021 [Amanita rubescens]